MLYLFCDYEVRFSSVQSRPTLCDPVNHSTPGLPVHHQLPECYLTFMHISCLIPKSKAIEQTITLVHLGRLDQNDHILLTRSQCLPLFCIIIQCIYKTELFFSGKWTTYLKEIHVFRKQSSLYMLE